jgi:hypothetical protein
LLSGAFQITAWLEAKLATDYLELAGHLGGTPLPAQLDLVQIADHYRRGAEANLTLVDKLAVEVQFADEEVPVSLGKRLMALADPYYGVANAGMHRVLPRLPQLLGEGEQLEYVRLAGSIWMHSVTAALVAKHYSIGVEQEGFEFKRVLRPAPLEQWIVQSRQGTEGAIHALVERGLDASSCIANYWIARNAEKKSKPHERFEALQSYFHAHSMAQVLIELSARNVGTGPGTPAPATEPVTPPGKPPLAPRAAGTAVPPPAPPSDGAGVTPPPAPPGVTP